MLFHEMLAGRRRERFESQEAFRRALTAFGVSVTSMTVSRWERGDAVPRGSNMIGILDCLDVPTDERGVWANRALKASAAA